jgi:hypothetical protein
MASPAEVTFPLWLEFSGLPTHLLDVAKGPAAWLLFRKIVELDLEIHPLSPGLVEITPRELVLRSGLDLPRIEKNLKVLRKAALVRAFYPDHEEEPALFEVLRPLPVPVSPESVCATHPDRFPRGPASLRYAQPAAGDASPTTDGDLRAARLLKINRVVELYLNLFSMKLNGLIAEELQLIADSYELPLVEKVFQRAHREEKRTLGWIVREIRRERDLQLKAAQIAADPQKVYL